MSHVFSWELDEKLVLLKIGEQGNGKHLQIIFPFYFTLLLEGVLLGLKNSCVLVNLVIEKFTRPSDYVHLNFFYWMSVLSDKLHMKFFIHD